MAWIESHQRLARHPKVDRLAAALRVSKAAVIGHLHLLWWWTLEFASDGDLAGFDEAEIAGAAEWEGAAGHFVASLRQAGWLDADGRVHDWRDYAGRLLDSRAQARERMRRFRARERERREAAQPERQLPAMLTVVPDRSDPGAGDEEWRQALRGHEEFHALWRAWQAHRAETGKPLSRQQEQAILFECARQGPDRSAEVIRFSLQKGAKNLIWSDAPAGKRATGAKTSGESIAPAIWRAFLAAEYPLATGNLSPVSAPAVVLEEFRRWEKNARRVA